MGEHILKLRPAKGGAAAAAAAAAAYFAEPDAPDKTPPDPSELYLRLTVTMAGVPAGSERGRFSTPFLF